LLGELEQADRYLSLGLLLLPADSVAEVPRHLLHRLEVLLALELVDPAQGCLPTIHGLERDDAVAGDLDGRLDAPTTYVVGVEVEAASSELEVAQHVVCSPLVIVLEESVGVPTRSTVVEAQEAEHVDEREGKAPHVILGNLQREAHMAVVACWRRLDFGIDDLEINNAGGADQIVFDGFVLVGHGAEDSPNSSTGWQVSTCTSSMLRSASRERRRSVPFSLREPRPLPISDFRHQLWGYDVEARALMSDWG